MEWQDVLKGEGPGAPTWGAGQTQGEGHNAQAISNSTWQPQDALRECSASLPVMLRSPTELLSHRVPSPGLTHPTADCTVPAPFLWASLYSPRCGRYGGGGLNHNHQHMQNCSLDEWSEKNKKITPLSCSNTGGMLSEMPRRGQGPWCLMQ